MALSGSRSARDGREQLPQAIWRGTISFALVNVPVGLYPATRKKDVRFHELDALTGQRIRHQRVRPAESLSLPGLLEDSEDLPLPARSTAWRQPEERKDQPSHAVPTETASGLAAPEGAATRDVAPEEVVKGFEVAPNRYVTVSRAELESLAAERSRTIDIEQFIDASAVDPIYYETSYYVGPDPAHARSFALLLEAMRRTEKLAICWIVLRRRRHLAALRPYGGVMLLTTMLHADEVLPRAELEPQAPADLTKKEREMATLLVNTLSGPFEPERYRDEYRQRLLDLIQQRRPAETPVFEPTSAKVDDLMAALRASLERARQRPAKPQPEPAGRHKRKSA